MKTVYHPSVSTAELNLKPALSVYAIEETK